MALDISASKVDSITVLSLKGTIVAGSSSDLLQNKIQQLLDAGEIRLILDLGQITFIDSTGIGSLIRVSTAASRKRGTIKLLHLTKHIHDVLQITRLSSVFGIFDDLQKAIESFGTEVGEKTSSGTGPPAT